MKQPSKQPEVAEDIVSPFLSIRSIVSLENQVRQLESGETSSLIMGVMIESNLVEGRQDIPASGRTGLKYGQSVTDGCISWEQTVSALERLRAGVRGRRELVKKLAHA